MRERLYGLEFQAVAMFSDTTPYPAAREGRINPEIEVRLLAVLHEVLG